MGLLELVTSKKKTHADRHIYKPIKKMGKRERKDVV